MSFKAFDALTVLGHPCRDSFQEAKAAAILNCGHIAHLFASI